ncbi:MAG: Flp pilus assembly protein CpaB [Alphaproteobacteria bacterium]|nr:Flp pilus assembly protein CpaB [Alphaproteobacteria bacterium]
MNGRNIALIAVALGFAVGAFFMFSAYLSKTKEDIKTDIEAKQRVVPPTIPTARVLVAKKDLIVGTFVKREDLHWQLWPEESITPAYVTDSKLLDAGKSDQQRLSIEDFVGGVVRMPIAGGQPMVKGLVSKAGERGFLAAVLQPGMRAMSVPSGGGVSGFILPGDHVDILWDVMTSKKGFPFTQTLFRDIRVIAIDQKTNATGATPSRMLTLELTPFQTEAMSLAQNMGGIEFTLRSIVPEKDKDTDSFNEGGLESDLLARVGLGRSDGIEKGALLGSELMAVAKEKEIKEIARDSWTVGENLLFGKGMPSGRDIATSTPAPRPVVAPRKASGPSVPVPSGSQSGRINIVRGTATQTIKVKK